MLFPEVIVHPDTSILLCRNIHVHEEKVNIKTIAIAILHAVVVVLFVLPIRANTVVVVLSVCKRIPLINIDEDKIMR